MTAVLPPDVFAGEAFAVVTRTHERQVEVPQGGREGDTWKFELDVQTGRVVNQHQVEMSADEKQQRAKEREDVKREKERFEKVRGFRLISLLYGCFATVLTVLRLLSD